MHKGPYYYNSAECEILRLNDIRKRKKTELSNSLVEIQLTEGHDLQDL